MIGNLDFKGTIFPIQYPSGTWGFVGAVPMELAYTLPDGSPLPLTLQAAVKSFGPGLFTRSGQIKAVTFPTKEAAVEAAHALGYVAEEPGLETSKGMKKAPPAGLRTVSCGCCTEGCICGMHEDVRRTGRRQKVCAYHQTTPHPLTTSPLPESSIPKHSGGPTLGAGNSYGRTEGMSYLDKDNL